MLHILLLLVFRFLFSVFVGKGVGSIPFLSFLWLRPSIYFISICMDSLPFYALFARMHVFFLGHM